MSAVLNTKRALERRLSQGLTGVSIAYEGVSFTPPNNATYLRTQFLIAQPDDPTIGDLYYRERITFQVFVVGLSNKGTASALQTAEQVRALFKKGTTLNESGTNIYVLGTPKISGTSVVNDRIIIPVMIEIVAEVYE